MLALSRKVGESIIINDNIELVVLSVGKDQVKIGIEAPKDVTVYRKELYLQIQEENKAASETSQEGAKALRELLGENED